MSREQQIVDVSRKAEKKKRLIEIDKKKHSSLITTKKQKKRKSSWGKKENWYGRSVRGTVGLSVIETNWVLK